MSDTDDHDSEADIIDLEEEPICHRIEYCNKSEDPQVSVVVATKNLSDQPSTAEEKLVAWKILKTQARVYFRYPMKTQVGAYYKHDHEMIMCGPYHAEDGSAWKIKQNSVDDAPELVEGGFMKPS